MKPPAPLIRTARQLWHCQWQLLMGGLGPADAQGRYRRPAPAFGELPALPADADAAGIHTLIVGRSCPWAHRAWLTWSLRGLGERIQLVVVEPDPAAGRWRFTSPFEGCGTLAELYRASGSAAGAPASVPALHSRSQGRILVNESARLIELLNGWPGGGPDLWPGPDRAGIDAWRQRLQGDVNDGVYRCGFARNQAAYDEAEGAFWAGLEAVERQLRAQEERGGQAVAPGFDAAVDQGTGDGADAGGPPAPASPGSEGSTEGAAAATGAWLCGQSPTLADVVLFPTLIRLELVYGPLFGCGRRPLRQLPALARWRARFHALPGVAATCFPQAWQSDYFGALFPLRPSGIVPRGPALEELVRGEAAAAARIGAETPT